MPASSGLPVHGTAGSSASSSRFRGATTLDKLILQLAAQDWLLLGYLVVLGGKIFFGAGPKRPVALACVGIDLAIFVAAVWRARRERSVSFGAALAYRFGILVALLGTFFQLQWILPAASGPPVDADLYAFDVRVFGTEPSLAWDRFVRPGTTEWFSFFYYGYFIVLALHVFPALFFGTREKLIVPLGFGILWLYVVGHIVYTFVPAYGPYAHLTFRNALEGDTWWPLVKRTVASVDGSARTDVFPSLHTAGPSFLTLYSFVYRKFRPYRYTWPILGFAATQIIIATMFLRWHYLIDICAGLTLAVSGVVAGRLALTWDEARVVAGGPAAFPPLTWPAWLAGSRGT
jgi:hypothetical protein